ncbi:hypothetical protein BIWAKO_06408 [Bosea sp. BIWAKO-01]|nr:hypothetical protein BIWAKO_06408 [Bosea sp. BIWAKO-01]
MAVSRSAGGLRARTRASGVGRHPRFGTGGIRRLTISGEMVEQEHTGLLGSPAETILHGDRKKRSN